MPAQRKLDNYSHCVAHIQYNQIGRALQFDVSTTSLKTFKKVELIKNSTINSTKIPACTQFSIWYYRILELF